MTDELMQEVTDAAVNFQQATANRDKHEADMTRLAIQMEHTAALLNDARRELEQARTRLTRASLALDPSTSMET